jgi:hypothetical protein
MKTMLKTILAAGCLVSLSAWTSRASIIADWTFETSQPATAGPISPESGNGSATGSHVGATVYSSPAGNGSSHSYSSTLWAVGDYYQFQVNTLGEMDIQLSWDQASSNTGPGQFGLFYSTDGVNFTQFGADYTVLANAAPNPVWNAITPSPLYSYNVDLSSINALNNAATVYFRLTDNSTVSANGGMVGTGGTDRVDNFEVTGSDIVAAVPEASTWYAGIGLSFVMLGSFVRKIRK